MIITIYGAGYVGLVSAACLAACGHNVICVDINIERIARLNRGECPIHEAGLPELLQAGIKSGRLSFSDNLVTAVKQATIHIIATGTPGLADGNADLSQVFSVASLIAEHAQRDGIVVTKSTVPVGTGDQLEAIVSNKPFQLDVASNPEFLREGCAVSDFFNADRIVIGGSLHVLKILTQLYKPLTDKGVPLLSMSRRSAELTKYAANGMLACKISYINQISQLAEELGADIDEIRQGMALDHRIGPHFLQAGIGYGGSCFPKDVRALIQIANSAGVDSDLLSAIDEVNITQKKWIFKQISNHFSHQLNGLKIGFWGVAFKPGTDDLREASSLIAMKELLKAGVEIIAFDPVIKNTAQAHLNNERISWCDHPDDVFNTKLHALVIATEWPIFKEYPLKKLQEKLQGSPLFDGRNCYTLDNVRTAKIDCYYSVGRPTVRSENKDRNLAYER